MNTLLAPGLYTMERECMMWVEDKLPSVTTILAATQSQEKQASLAAWRARVGTNEAARITDQAATRGTSMHTNIRRIYFRSEPCRYD
jgi:hypothetical protein